MKVRLEEHRGGSNSKLACVKRVKELTGKGLKEAKELVDRCCYGEHVEFEVKAYYNRGDIEKMKCEFDTWGFKLSGGRSDVLDDLLGDSYKYTVEYLHREVTYKIEEGKFDITDGKYVFDIKIGVKIDGSVEHSINDRKVTIPVESVSIEENLLYEGI